jgi:hypothetical protein
MWDEWARDKDNVLRCDLVGGGADVEVRVTDSTISFRDLSPGFVKRFGGRGTPKWANVVQVRDYSRIPESASVIPAGLPGLDRLLGSVPFGETWATREGIVIACKYVDWNHRWTLPSGLDVFQAWAKGHTFEIDLSGPGRVATQVIRALGGTWGSRFLAHEEIIRLLNQMASGLVESEAEEEGNGGQRKKVRGKIVKVGEWRTRLKQVNSGHEDVAKRHLDFLVLHKVLDVGLRL